MLQLNPHFDSIGPQFVQVYYETFRSNRYDLSVDGRGPLEIF